MLSNKIKRYIINPCLGLTPLLLYYILALLGFNIGASLIIALAFGIIAEFALRHFTKVAQMGFYITFLVIGLTYLIWISTKSLLDKPYFYLILPEILSVLVGVIVRFFKKLLNYKLAQKYTAPLQKLFFNEFFDTTIYVQYTFTLHIFIIFVLLFLESIFSVYNYNYFIFYISPILLILFLISTENLKLSQIAKKLKKENWLPIVNEKGDITGKIARSVSVKLKNRYLHPVVRLALVCNGKLYIQKRKSDLVVDPDKLDHPFEKYVLYGHDIKEAVNNCITKVLGKELPHRFILKYVYETEITNRLIFLHVVDIKDEDELRELNTGELHGKFWTTKQIDEEYGDPDLFCECFQLEYEYLKNVVLYADEIINHHADVS